MKNKLNFDEFPWGFGPAYRSYVHSPVTRSSKKVLIIPFSRERERNATSGSGSGGESQWVDDRCEGGNCKARKEGPKFPFPSFLLLGLDRQAWEGQ